MLEKTDFERGLEKGWELAQKIDNLPDDKKPWFPNGIQGITYKEAEKDFDGYMRDFHVGDIVEYLNDSYPHYEGCVLNPDYNGKLLVSLDGRVVPQLFDKYYWIKTGRRVPDLAKYLGLEKDKDNEAD